MAKGVSTIAGYFMNKYGMEEPDAKFAAKHVFDAETIDDLEKHSVEKLQEMIANNIFEVDKLTDEAHSKPEYVDAKDIVALYNSTLKETLDPYKARLKLFMAMLQFKKRNKEI